MIRLRVATYNVHKCRGLDLRISPERIANVIQDLNADVIALQEVVATQMDRFCDRLEMNHVFGAARKLDRLDYGNAILSRFSIAATRSYDLSVKQREPRGCLRAELDLGAERKLHFFAVHLGTSFFERRHQGRKLVSQDILGVPEVQTPRILAGDFNEWTKGLATQMLSGHMKSADISFYLKSGRTYPGVIPFLHLDHIYYDQTLRLVNLRLHRTATSLVASDHLPLVADFEWTEID